MDVYCTILVELSLSEDIWLKTISITILFFLHGVTKKIKLVYSANKSHPLCLDTFQVHIILWVSAKSIFYFYLFFLVSWTCAYDYTIWENCGQCRHEMTVEGHHAKKGTRTTHNQPLRTLYMHCYLSVLLCQTYTICTTSSNVHMTRVKMFTIC